MIIRRKYCRPLLLFLLILAVVLSFPACSSNSDAANSIWVVTEESDEDGMNQQVRQVIKAFQADHPGVTVTLDVLPTDSGQREIVLKQLRDGEAGDADLEAQATQLLRELRWQVTEG